MENIEYEIEDFIFQIDSPIVKTAYASLNNYLICEDEVNEVEDKYCAIYFSGHSIYFPNNEETFKREIIQKNRFEWYGLRVRHAFKHIFLRDIHKQWYLTGINASVNSPELLYEFLKKETDGYKVICIGSSAGGYAALLYGSLLNAEITYAFSPRIEMFSLERYSTPKIAPFFFKYKNSDRSKYMDILPFIGLSKSPFYAFYPNKSNLDRIQLNHIKKNWNTSLSNLHIIQFNTSKHGVPFPKVALEECLSYSNEKWGEYVGKTLNPMFFSIRQVGIWRTIKGCWHQLFSHYIKSRH